MRVTQDISVDDNSARNHGSSVASPGWRARLYPRFHGQAYPLLVFEDTIVPAASIWAGARIWIAAFRERGLKSGDRIVLALPESPAFLFILLAALWSELTLILPGPTQDPEETMELLDAAVAVAEKGAAATWTADPCGLPVATGKPVRPPHGPATPDARLLLSTSGTLGAARWIALSDENIFSVLDSHTPRFGLEDARVLSVLPWRHAFGMVIDLLPALLCGAEMVRAGCGGRDIENVRRLLIQHDISHLNAVPMLIDRLSATAEGEACVRRLRGGVIGGARGGASLARFLTHTTLRVGYGQTEASPGIALGEPGNWREGYLGRPVGCRVRLDQENILQFSGTNACLGEWRQGNLVRLEPGRWASTGDIVRQEGEDLTFVARADDGFKLTNGRYVQAGVWENVVKTRFPQCREAMLFTLDGESLQLVVAVEPKDAIPSLASVRDCLGGLCDRLTIVRNLALAEWSFTPKGEIDRPSTLRSLAPVLFHVCPNA